jgi:hypothetical protein
MMLRAPVTVMNGSSGDIAQLDHRAMDRDADRKQFGHSAGIG